MRPVEQLKFKKGENGRGERDRLKSVKKCKKWGGTV
jgi:hypothetical protein